MKKLFDNYKGKEVFQYTLKDEDIEVDIIDFGARINAIRVKGVDIVLGCNKVEDFMHDNFYLGATVGRSANRIKDSKFTLNGIEYKLTNNENNNQLHGGFLGFDKQIFNLESFRENRLCLSYLSKDGEEGYPGDLILKVVFSLENNSLKIEYTATSNKDTIFAPTCHAYFNLDGEDKGDALDNLLMINSDEITITGPGLISTGETMKVENTPFDFRELRTIRKKIDDDCLKSTRGYDHNFILNSEKAAVVKSNKTGIEMQIFTDLPCVQLYTAGFLHVNNGKSRGYIANDGFCIEPQYVPNTMNLEGFAKPIVKKGTVSQHYIKYLFIF